MRITESLYNQTLNPPLQALNMSVNLTSENVYSSCAANKLPLISNGQSLNGRVSLAQDQIHESVMQWQYGQESTPPTHQTSQKQTDTNVSQQTISLQNNVQKIIVQNSENQRQPQLPEQLSEPHFVQQQSKFESSQQQHQLQTTQHITDPHATQQLIQGPYQFCSLPEQPAHIPVRYARKSSKSRSGDAKHSICSPRNTVREALLQSRAGQQASVTASPSLGNPIIRGQPPLLFLRNIRPSPMYTNVNPRLRLDYNPQHYRSSFGNVYQEPAVSVQYAQVPEQRAVTPSIAVAQGESIDARENVTTHAPAQSTSSRPVDDKVS